jgi:hypothetical protein
MNRVKTINILIGILIILGLFLLAALCLAVRDLP